MMDSFDKRDYFTYFHLIGVPVMKEWQIGLLSGGLATICFIMFDLFSMLPYVVELVIAFVVTLTGAFIGNKWINYRRKHQEH